MTGTSSTATPRAGCATSSGTFLRPRELRATGMVVGCRRDTQELFAIQVGANRVTEKLLWPRSTQSRETRRKPLPSRTPTAQVIDLATRRARA